MPAVLRAALLVGLAAACGPSDPQTRVTPRRESHLNRSANAVSTILGEDLEQVHSARLEEMLAARVPGLEVLPAGGGQYRLRIRGAQTFMGNDEPLLVVDGMSVRTGGVSQALMMIQPQDVARIEVLKDAGATAFYGMRGAGGVILITTRRR